MSRIERNNVIEGSMVMLEVAGPPVAGTDTVQTITFGGTPTGGTFRLNVGGWITAPIAWSATNNTLRDNVDAALEALPNVGANNVTTAVGTMTAGIGTLTVTFTAALGKQVVPVMTADASGLTGTAPTVAVAITTPGVQATQRQATPSVLLTDTTNNILYQNAGTVGAPNFGKVGPQS